MNELYVHVTKVILAANSKKKKEAIKTTYDIKINYDDNMPCKDRL